MRKSYLQKENKKALLVDNLNFSNVLCSYQIANNKISMQDTILKFLKFLLKSYTYMYF